MPSTLSSPTVSVVIVNWNSGQALRWCIASVAASVFERATLVEVVVVDNASVDDSLAFEWPDSLQVRLIRNPRNLGFAAACNQGAARCSAGLLLFLNPDVVLEPPSIDTAAACFGRPKAGKLGVVGIMLRDRGGSPARSCARFFTPGRMLADILRIDRLFPAGRLSHRMLDWDHRETRAVDHVIGAFYLIRADLFRSLSGFDERFFVYLEDLDLSRRVALRGWQCLYLAEASAFHAGCGCSRSVPLRRKCYGVISRIRYARKYLGKCWVALGVLSVIELGVFMALYFLGLSPHARQEQETAGA